jgi:hypothetical protein
MALTVAEIMNQTGHKRLPVLRRYIRRGSLFKRDHDKNRRDKDKSSYEHNCMQLIRTYRYDRRERAENVTERTLNCLSLSIISRL